MPEYVPAAQAVQLLAAGAPSAVRYAPTSQLEHAERAVAPACVANVPAPHSSQADAPCSEKDPAPHSAQPDGSVAPTPDWYLPPPQ